MRIRDIWAVWDRIWFEPASPAPVCIFRLLFGLVVLISCLFLIPDLLTWYGPNAIISIETIKHYEHLPRFSLFFEFAPSIELTWGLFGLMTIAALFVMLGLFTRASSIVLFILLVSFHHRNPALLNSGDTFMRIATFLLIFTASDKMFSLDSWLRSKRSKKPNSDPWEITCSPWGQRLLQFQVGLIYCQTFWAKIIGDTWWNGTATYYSSRLEEFGKLPIPFVFDQLWTCQLLTWSTLAIELSLWTLIWVRELRYWVLLAGVLLHLGIDWTMNIPLFEELMIASFVNFIYPADLKRWIEASKKGFRRWALKATSDVS